MKLYERHSPTAFTGMTPGNSTVHDLAGKIAVRHQKVANRANRSAGTLGNLTDRTEVT